MDEAKLRKLFEQWETEKSESIISSDRYWQGGNSFLQFLVEQLKSTDGVQVP
jgi:hypothetical protein